LINFIKLNQAQVKLLIDSITKPAHVQENGLKISENEKYIFLRNDPDAKITILKKGAAGIVVCKSTQGEFILILFENIFLVVVREFIGLDWL
jgi:hypothetical protein